MFKSNFKFNIISDDLEMYSSEEFKEYKESSEDKSNSRHFKRFLNNDYMVCVGYAKLLMELCRRIGINTYDYSVNVDVSYDDGFTNEEKSSDFAGHARVIVALDDPKYNIHGFYVSNPTWDNDLKNDYYNHSLMFFDKVFDSKRYFKLADDDLLLDIKSFDELNEKYAIYYSRKIKKIFCYFISIRI